MQRVICLDKNGFTISKLNKKIKKRFEALNYKIYFEKLGIDEEKVSLYDLEYESKYYITIQELDEVLIFSTENEMDILPRRPGVYDEIFDVFERIVNGGTR